MGVRLNKALGYGILIPSDTFEKVYAPKIHHLSEEIDETGKLVAIEYAKYLDSQRDQWTGIFDSFFAHYAVKIAADHPEEPIPGINPDFSVHQMFTTVKNPYMTNLEQVMEGITLLLVIPPFVSAEWLRYDSTIDHYQHLFETHQSPMDRYTVLNRAVYPYNQHIMNRETGELKPYNGRTEFLWNLVYNEHDPELEPYDSISQAEHEVGLKELQDYWTLAAVPVELQAITEWAKFTEPGVNFTHKLQPMIAEFWS